MAKLWENAKEKKKENEKRKKTKEGGRTEGRKENGFYLITILVFSVCVRHRLD